MVTPSEQEHFMTSPCNWMLRLGPLSAITQETKTTLEKRITKYSEFQDVVRGDEQLLAKIFHNN